MVTAEFLRTILRYEPETGDLIWIKRRGGVAAGSVAGYAGPNSYRQVSINKRLFQGHRLAWLLMTGEWPVGDIDHIDGDQLNNKWGNLRDVSRTTNNQNQRRPHIDGSTGFLGVSPSNGRFMATIAVDGKTKYLGRYLTREQASAAYIAAKRELHAGCTL